MVGRGSAQFCSQGRATQVIKLVGVDLERESQLFCFYQDLFRLLQIKGLVLT